MVHYEHVLQIDDRCWIESETWPQSPAHQSSPSVSNVLYGPRIARKKWRFPRNVVKFPAIFYLFFIQKVKISLQMAKFPGPFFNPWDHALAMLYRATISVVQDSTEHGLWSDFLAAAHLYEENLQNVQQVGEQDEKAVYAKSVHKLLVIT